MSQLGSFLKSLLKDIVGGKSQDLLRLSILCVIMEMRMGRLEPKKIRGVSTEEKAKEILQGRQKIFAYGIRKGLHYESDEPYRRGSTRSS